jgi:hypothetical protein
LYIEADKLTRAAMGAITSMAIKGDDIDVLLS